MGQYLIFIIEDEFYGIDIATVVEIIGIQKITQMPQQPDYVNGVINRRGKIIPIIDVRARFSRSKAEHDDRTCIIVIDVQEMKVGFIVDGVEEVATIADGKVTKPPTFNHDFKGSFIKGIAKIDDNIIMLLDSSLLLSEEELEDVQGFAVS